MRHGQEIIWKDHGTFRHCIFWGSFETPPCVRVKYRGVEWTLKPDEIMPLAEYEAMLFEARKQAVAQEKAELIAAWQSGVRKLSELASKFHRHHLAVQNQLNQLRRLGLINDKPVHENENAMVE